MRLGSSSWREERRNLNDTTELDSGTDLSWREGEKNLKHTMELLTEVDWNRLEQRGGSGLSLQQQHLEQCSVVELRTEK